MTLQEYSKTLQPETVVFREGEPGDCAYIVDKGMIELSTLIDGKAVVLARVGPGELFGELALLDNQMRNATAKALEETQLIVIPREFIDSHLESAAPLVSLLLNTVLRHYREMRQRMFLGANDVLSDESRTLAGASTLEVYSRDLKRTAERLERENRLRTALNNEEFELYYQPIVTLDGRLTGFEALIRWVHPALGMIPPDSFIGLAEECGLIVQMGDWIVDEACAALSRFQQACAERASLRMSINFSGRQFESEDLCDKLGKTLRKHSVAPQQIRVEITETLLMGNPELALKALNVLRERQFSVALDDFGTGYSSFSYLHRFPIDVLKVDKSFTSTMMVNNKSMGIVQSVVALARSLGLSVVAEGVETRAQLERLRELGCDYGQGYFFSKPLPESQVLEKLCVSESCWTISDI